MHLDNIESIKQFGLHHGFRLCTYVRYLRGYIVDGKSKHHWLKKGTETWEKKIFIINKNMGKHPQESYAAVVCEIDLEWVFLQHNTKNMGYTFV